MSPSRRADRGDVAITIGDSLMSRLIDVLVVSGGVDESVTVTEIGYFPALVGLPDSCPDAFNVRPGGRGPDSAQLNGGAPPDAANV